VSIRSEIIDAPNVRGVVHRSQDRAARSLRAGQAAEL